MNVSTVVFHILLLLSSTLYSQISTFTNEESEPFSYYKTSVDQLGFKDCPEAMAVTNGGLFSNAFVGIEFLYGEELKTAVKRVLHFDKDYLPIISFELSEGNITYMLDAFSTTLDLDPSGNLITFVRWKVFNTVLTALQMSIILLMVQNLV